MNMAHEWDDPKSNTHETPLHRYRFCVKCGQSPNVSTMTRKDES